MLKFPLKMENIDHEFPSCLRDHEIDWHGEP